MESENARGGCEEIGEIKDMENKWGERERELS